MKKITTLLAIFIAILATSCSVKYNFTGTGKIDANTFQVNKFMNNAPIVEPGVDRDFTLKLQDLIQNQTNVSLTNSNADLVYEGEIVDYRIEPMSATANITAAKNRITVTINVRFTNKKKEEDNVERRFTFYDDYPAEVQFTGTQKTKSLELIFARITQDIFNESLAKW